MLLVSVFLAGGGHAPVKSAMALFSTIRPDGEGAAEALIGTGIVAAMPGGVHIKGVPGGPVGAQAPPPYGLYICQGDAAGGAPDTGGKYGLGTWYWLGKLIPAIPGICGTE